MPLCRPSGTRTVLRRTSPAMNRWAIFMPCLRHGRCFQTPRGIRCGKMWITARLTPVAILFCSLRGLDAKLLRRIHAAFPQDAPARGDAGLGTRPGRTKGPVVKQVDISATVNVPALAWVVTGTGRARRETALKNGEVGKVYDLIGVEIAEPTPFHTARTVPLVDAVDGSAVVPVH